MSEITPVEPPRAEQPAAPPTPPGWYPDASTPGMQRWWTGRDWSDQRQPIATQQNTTVVIQPKRVNHALHLVLSILTFGLWLPVWLILAIANS